MQKKVRVWFYSMAKKRSKKKIGAGRRQQPKKLYPWLKYFNKNILLAKRKFMKW